MTAIRMAGSGSPDKVWRPWQAISRLICALIALALLGTPTRLPAAERPRVMVVMSYAEENEWCQTIRLGIEARLGDTCDLFYIYLNTRSQPQKGKQRAAAAYDRYQELQPQGVIAVDDNAQTHFVIPYLRDRVDTPVIFCGVNAAPEAYRYPATNVSGVLERYHITETVALLQQLVPSAQRVAFVGLDAPTGRLMLQQAQDETLPALSQTHFFTVKTFEELMALATSLRKKVDAIYLSILRGLVDAKGTRLSDRQIIQSLTTAFAKPVVSAAFYDLPHGVLCSVVHTGEEQGQLAGELMAKALAGVPVAQLPITRNYNGERVINVTVMQKLGITPRPILLRGATLIRSAP